MNKRRRNTCQQQVTVIKRRKTSKREAKNWLDLPQDIMLLIFMKLGVIEVLLNAQVVCSSWRKLAKDPQLFRSIDIGDPREYFAYKYQQFLEFGREAVNRSCGQLVELTCTDKINYDTLRYAVDRSNSLKYFRIGPRATFSECGLIEAARRLPLLEELDLCVALFPKHLIKELGRCCQKLKYFRLNYRHSFHDDEAVAIAENMPQLHRLHIIGSTVTNNVLQAILDGCPQLEYLDVRHCYSAEEPEQDLVKRCEGRFRNVWLPSGSSEDYLKTTDYYQTSHWGSLLSEPVCDKY